MKGDWPGRKQCLLIDTLTRELALCAGEEGVGWLFVYIKHLFMALWKQAAPGEMLDQWFSLPPEEARSSSKLPVL